jgi:hypothetical protein
MPKDHWQKGKDEAAARRLKQPSPFGRRAKIASRNAQRAEKYAQQQQAAAVIASRIGPETPIWFGQYQGTKLRDLPPSYRRWLANVTSADPTIQHLARFLRSYRPPATPAKGESVQSCAGPNTPRPSGTADKRSTTNPKGGIPSGGV